MGLCASNKNNSEKKYIQAPVSTEAVATTIENKIFSISDLGEIKPAEPYKTTDKLKFQTTLSNFRLRNVRDTCFYFLDIKFPTDTGKSKSYTMKLASGPNVKFNFKDNFDINLEYEKIKNLKLNIKVYEINKNTKEDKYADLEQYAKTARPLSVIEVDLITLIIGPEHHDIQLLSGASKVGRVIFDTSFVHMSDIFFELKNITCTVKNLNKRDICFKLKLSTSSNETNISDFSYPIIDSKVDVNNKLIIYNWINSQQDFIGFTKSQTAVSEISSSSLKLLFFDTKLESSSTRTDNTKLDCFLHDIEGKSYIFKPTDVIGVVNFNIQSLLSENNDTMTKQASRFFKQGSSLYQGGKVGTTSSQVNTNGISDEANEGKKDIIFNINQNIEKTFCEDIYAKDKPIGKIEGRILIKNIPIIKQIICGVHTERGFDLASHYLTYISDTNSKKDIGKELKLINSETNHLLVKLSEQTSLTNTNTKDRKNEISNHLKEIIKALEYSIKDSCLFYAYTSISEIMTAHEIFLNLGNNIVAILDGLEIDHRRLAYKIIETLMIRAEFDLSTFTCHFDNEELPLKKRRHIVKSFIKFTNGLTKHAIDKFAKRIKEIEVQKLVENILAYSYFRSIKFRNSFLSTISENCNFLFENSSSLLPKHRRFDKLNYTEMKKFSDYKFETVYTIEEKTRDEEKHSTVLEENVNPIFSTIDWEGLFYEKLHLLSDDKTSVDLEIIEEINDIEKSLSTEEWHNRLKHRGNGFFGLIKQLEDYIKKKIIVNRDIDWSDIPGFEQIIFILIHELKTRNVGNYPKILIEVLGCFINNSELINIFFTTIVNNTNVNDVSSVNNLFSILDYLFHEAAKSSICTLRNSFDFGLLKRCFAIIFELDHSIVVSKLFWFLYENSHLIAEEQLVELLYHTFLEDNFYKYFFHWAWQVRHLFYHYVLYCLMTRIKPSSKSIMWNDKIDKNSFQRLENNSFIIVQKIIKAKLEEVEDIKEFIRDRNLNPTFKNQFSVKEFNIIKNREAVMEKFTEKYVILGMQHFESILTPYNDWKHNNTIKKIEKLVYPDMSLTELKDDVIDYSEQW